MRPGGLLCVRKEGQQFLNRVLCELAIGGDLAAVNVEQRRAACVMIELQRVVARDLGWVVVAIIVQWTHTGVGGHDVALRKRLGEIGVGEIEQILRFILADVWRVKFGHGYIGSTNQRIAFEVRNHEHDSAVPVLQNVGVRRIMHARHDDVRALDVLDGFLGGGRVDA